MTRYRSTSPATRLRQEAVFASLRTAGLPRVNARWTLFSRDGRKLCTGSDFWRLLEVGEGTVLPTGHPLTHPGTGAMRPRRESAVDLERTARRAGKQ